MNLQCLVGPMQYIYKIWGWIWIRKEISYSSVINLPNIFSKQFCAKLFFADTFRFYFFYYFKLDLGRSVLSQKKEQHISYQLEWYNRLHSITKPGKSVHHTLLSAIRALTDSSLVKYLIREIEKLHFGQTKFSTKHDANFMKE